MKNRVRLDQGRVQTHRCREKTWLPVGRGGEGRGAIGVGEQGVQATSIRQATRKINQINYKDKLYNTGKTISCNNYEWSKT